MDKDDLIQAVADHKKTCFPKSNCEICMIDYSKFSCESDDCNPRQCDWCGKAYNSIELLYYECVCERGSVMHLCDSCEDMKTSPIVVIFSKLQPKSHPNYMGYHGYSFGTKGYDDYVRGAYIDKCCPMTLQDYRNHQETCYHKGHCDLCGFIMEGKYSTRYTQCDYCSKLFDSEETFWYNCKCCSDDCLPLHLCKKCHEAPLHHLLIEEPESGCEGIYSCHDGSVTKAVK
tara:strand:- start:30553 stop:31242 length:690 start_codon:yes stop_codon:yes gene_type:complete